MITVDVEAQPARARDRHVHRLIWGAYPEGRAGIREMMDIAELHDISLTMFFDWAETDLYGEHIEEVGREIDDRGHDLQLHVHAEFFSEQFWRRHDIEPEGNLDLVETAQAEAIVGEIVERQKRATGRSPIAFRGGGYRLSAPLLQALRTRGVLLDSSLNTVRRIQSNTPFCNYKQFLWPNGVAEVPISLVDKFKNCPRPLEFNFNSGYFTNATSMHQYLDAFWNERGPDAIAVLVMHSWSFLALGGDGLFTYPGTDNLERFRAFVAGLGDRGIRVIGARDALQLILGGAVETDSADAAATVPDIGRALEATVVSCPVCGAPKKEFTKLDGRQCSHCGSLERQRCFAIAYDAFLHRRFNIRGKDIFVLSPSSSEVRFLKARGAAKTASADIMPERKPDFVVDYCAMPGIGTGSRAVVFASYVMPLVHDLDQALDEVARVLEDGGVFFSVETPTTGETQEVQDENEQAEWYGADVLQRYRVGIFRTLGRYSYLAKLRSRFEVQLEVVVDPITGNEATIYACRKGQQLTPHIPHPRNDEEFEDLDTLYFSRKVQGLTLTYARYMTRLEYREVSDGDPHPSLGGNVSDRDEKGEYNFNLYRKFKSDIGPATRVLEYGCGTLRIGEKFMEFLGRGNYFGMDVQPGFLEIGRQLVRKSLLETKDPILTDISPASIERAVEFGADFIYSNSVAFHVHQDDLIEYFGNLARIASKPGAILIFDAKIAEEATRYNHSGWAWPLDLYKQLLKPLIFVRLIGDRPYAHADNCVVAHLEFRAPE